jgi:hypothetical protein
VSDERTRHRFWQGWGAKENLLAPVVVNLLSAGLLFLCVVLFRPFVYKVLGIPLTEQEYPIYVTAEGFVWTNDLVAVDFFVINRHSGKYKDQVLTPKVIEDLMATGDSDSLAKWSPDIEVRVKEDFRKQNVRLLRIEYTNEFNGNKGVLEGKTNAQTATVSVQRIGPRSILKFTVFTDYPNQFMNRATTRLIPLEFKHPGKDWKE